jgi:hypothetical protein
MPTTPAKDSSDFAGAPNSGLWRGRAFGVELQGSFPVLRVSASRNTPEARRTSLEIVAEDDLGGEWPSREAASLVTRRFHNGSPMMTVDYHEKLGYRIWAVDHGTHIVSCDGYRIRSALPDPSNWHWQTLFFAQVLPLAAKLRGLGIFHASAVALDGRALAFFGASGTGKSSVAAHLVARGARFLADDVVAVEPTAGGVRAYPGAGLAGVDREELVSLGERGRERLGTVIGYRGKAYLEVEVIDESYPLCALYALERTTKPGEVRIEKTAPPDPRTLLAGAFITYVREARSLINHLDACARIANLVKMYRVEVPAGRSARDVAVAIELHARRSNGGTAV